MQRDSLHEIKGSDLHVMREILNKYIIYENINVIERHSGLFVVTLNPIKLSGVLSMNLEYDKKKKKMTSGNWDEKILFLDSLRAAYQIVWSGDQKMRASASLADSGQAVKVWVIFYRLCDER